MPAMPTGTPAQQIRQQYAYLFQLAQTLNLALEQVDGAVQSASSPAQAQQTRQAQAQAEQAEREQQAASLKSLILKTAHTVQEETERLERTLTGKYVAQSDFGAYLEQISQEVAEDPSGIQRYFKFASDIQADLDRVSTDFSAYKTDVEGYIRQGIVAYDGATPILGIAIGQDIKTAATGVETEQGKFDVIDKSSNMSVWTAEKLSFYIGGTEAAYFSHGKLTVAQLATDRLVGAGQWDVSFLSGIKFKWIGG